jgi:hypothetical protein
METPETAEACVEACAGDTRKAPVKDEFSRNACTAPKKCVGWRLLVTISSSVIARIAVLAAVCASVAFVPNAFGRSSDTGEPAGTEIALYPIANANHVTRPFKATAFIVEREEGESFVDQKVTLLVISGPNAGKTLNEQTDANGAAHFTYTSSAAGTDVLQASYFDTDDSSRACSNLVAETWVPLGAPLPKPPPPPPVLPPSTSPPPSSSGGPVAGAQPTGCRAPGLVKTPGSTDFTPVQEGQPLPPGTQVDVSGESALTIQKPTGQTMTFFGVPDNVPSQFAITGAQNGGTGLIAIALTGGNFTACKGSTYRYLSGLVAKKPPPKKPKPVRRLWGSGKGSYKTTGKYASATVRGTFWLVADYCNGTLITVRKGSVIVHDRVKNKNVIVKPGKPYFAASKP